MTIRNTGIINIVSFTLCFIYSFYPTGTFPIDLTKTRLQVQGQSQYTEVRYRGMFHALFRIGKEEGIRALYSGYGTDFTSHLFLWVGKSLSEKFPTSSSPASENVLMDVTLPLRISPALLRQASYGTIKIGTYNSLKRLFVSRPEGERWLLLCPQVSFCVCRTDPTGLVWFSPLRKAWFVCIESSQSVNGLSVFQGRTTHPHLPATVVFLYFEHDGGTWWYFRHFEFPILSKWLLCLFGFFFFS